ncbi:MAG: hypothetical protein C0508_12100 [Cyanobacteria bacterium PR.023]|nr:hypothetical protein [Cyanobacteria bacterium PR.023]
MTTRKISDVLAEILVAQGKLYQAEIPMLVATSAKSGIPLGRILVTTQRLSELELLSALTAAKIVLNGQISIIRAAVILAYSFKTQLPFQLLWQRDELKTTNSVVLLLITSGLLDPSRVLKLANMSAPPLMIGGKDLFNVGLITLGEWQEALELVLQIKRRELSVRQALFEENEQSITGDNPAVTNLNPERQRLGYLLLQAGLVNVTELLNALECGLDSDELLGQVLVHRNKITASELRIALRIQTGIQSRMISTAQFNDWITNLTLANLHYSFNQVA